MTKNIYDYAKELKVLGIWTQVDIQFAMFLEKNHNPMSFFAYSSLSASFREGNICLSISYLNNPKKFFNKKYPFLAKKIWNLFKNPNKKKWKLFLLKEPAISNGKYVRPVILDNNKLYLYRMWKYECIIADFFINSYKYCFKYNKKNLIIILNKLFPYKNLKEINWQKIAILILLTRKVTILSGKPGTGKTFIISKFILSLIFLKKKLFLKIIVSAPTGKASANLHHTLNLSIKKNKKYSNFLKNISIKSTTLHRLLGSTKNNKKMFYNNFNKLNLDVLIIDESSMIDLHMFYNIIIACPKNALIIFIGDQYQLSPIESGSIFNDICKLSNIGYSKFRINEILKFTGINIFKKVNVLQKKGIYDNFCMLKTNYRFKKNSNINKLSNSINLGFLKKSLKILKSKKNKNIFYYNLITKKDYFFMIKNCIKYYKLYLLKIINNESPESILKTFNKYRLLCTLRKGPFGVEGLNKIIEYQLIKNKILNISNINTKKFYIGKPIMITKNSESLGLYNGDIGIFLFDYKKNNFYAFFQKFDNKIYKISLNKLPSYETAFAITVHKAQGSEFLKTSLVLPNLKLPILTRELLYTAITRTCKCFFLYGNDNILDYILKNNVNRKSGLIERINKNFI
ncbi:exodeoxyribonuclease V subunit alpha [Sodalis-like secondary symbiont of Drepanosiphum platanoidis]|uniref:exodeoxyribonuclease V subunit alpha n=1 Tax=Sodalis-like secondary symbiont of Drepanosiphum platanoidis TaxID=2994493 RepID=UPI0034648EB0